MQMRFSEVLTEGLVTAMDERIPLDQVLEDMCFHEVGWIQDAATAYYHREYLGEVRVKNPDRKWWQIWKPRYIWVKKELRPDYEE